MRKFLRATTHWFLLGVVLFWSVGLDCCPSGTGCCCAGEFGPATPSVKCCAGNHERDSERTPADVSINSEEDLGRICSCENHARWPTLEAKHPVVASDKGVDLWPQLDRSYARRAVVVAPHPQDCPTPPARAPPYATRVI